MMAGIRVSPGRVSRLVPVLSCGFLQGEVQTSGAWVLAVGSKSLAQPGALRRSCGGTTFTVSLSFLSAGVRGMASVKQQ